LSETFVIATFFKYPPEIRTLIYTTNPIESLHRQIKKMDNETQGLGYDILTTDDLF